MIKGVHAHYGKSHILKGVELHLRQGEILGLIGRNGMGKTTLLRVIAGLKTPSKGIKKIFSTDCTELPPHKISQLGIAYVPEKRGIFPNLTVRENLLMAARPRTNGDRIWGLDEVLKMFPQLEPRLNNGGSQLSGGEQQILAICRALMTNPEYVLIDEATEGLAPMVAEEVWTLLEEISSKGVGAIIVDKDLTSLSKVTNRFAIMMNGKLVFDGSSANLKSDLKLQKNFLGI